MTSRIINHRHEEALRTYQVMALIDKLGTNVFFAFGKSTPWTTADSLGASDTSPPSPDSIEGVPEVIFYKRALEVLPALSSPSGTIQGAYRDEEGLRGDRWHLIDRSLVERPDSYLVYPTHIYVSCEVEYEDYGQDAFRAVGLYSDLQPKTNIPTNKVIYLPSEVEKPGYLHWRAFSTPINRVFGKSSKIEVLL